MLTFFLDMVQFKQAGVVEYGGCISAPTDDQLIFLFL